MALSLCFNWVYQDYIIGAELTQAGTRTISRVFWELHIKIGDLQVAVYSNLIAFETGGGAGNDGTRGMNLSWKRGDGDEL